MAAPPAFSTYVAINQERQEQTLQLKRAAIFVAGLIALAVVSTVPLYLRSRVVVRGDDVAILAKAVSTQINSNQEIAYRIAWETAPQRLEVRARNLRLAPITKWEAVSVPGLTLHLKAARQTTTSATTAAAVASAAGQDGNPVGRIWSQVQAWLGLGVRGSAGQPPL